jgi:hypothetical protein
MVGAVPPLRETPANLIPLSTTRSCIRMKIAEEAGPTKVEVTHEHAEPRLS